MMQITQFFLEGESPTLNNIEITNYFNYEPRFNCVFSRNNLPKIKDGAYVINSMIKIVKERIGFHYSLIEMQLHTLILLEFNIFHKKY